jgi:ribonuclease P protein component
VAQRFPKTERLLRRKDFLRVPSVGRRVHTAHFVVMVQRAERRRLGITVTKRIGGAVVRNRIRRLVREAFRLQLGLFPERCEMVVVARQGASDLGYVAVAAELAGASPALRQAAATLSGRAEGGSR